MKAPAFPADETFRLDALRGLGLLDTAAEPDFDAIVALGKDLFSVPTCLVTLVDAERQWFKARVGLPAPETSRDISFCGHAILGEDVFVVLDAKQDPRFHDNPLVTGEPFIRFYAGAPIKLPSGYTIGTVCVISPEPRAQFGAADQTKLARLSALALNAISIRAMRAALDEARLAADQLSALLGLVNAPVALVNGEGRLEMCNEAFTALCGREMEGQLAAEVIPGFDIQRHAESQPTTTCTIAGSTLTVVSIGTGCAVMGSSAR